MALTELFKVTPGCRLAPIKSPYVTFC